MNSIALGENTSRIEVSNISMHGIWLFAKDREYFLPFENFPWFKDKPISAIFNVVEVSPGHFYWPVLDIDLTEEIIEHAERFPLIANYAEERIDKEKIA